MQAITDREENITAMNIENHFNNSGDVKKTIFRLFGDNVDFFTLLKLVVAQIYRTPDDYFNIKGKTLVESIAAQLTPDNYSANFSQSKSEFQSILKNLNNSNEEPFYAYLNFLWYSSLPCFDVENITAGVVNKNQYLSIIC